MASTSLLTNFIVKESQKIAREALKDLVDEYMVESQFIILLKNKYMPPLIQEVVEEAAQESAIESILDDYLERMIAELAPAMIQSQFDLLVEETEESEMDWAVSNHVKRALMSVLMEALRNSIIEKNKKEEIADLEIKKARHMVLDDDDDFVFKEGKV